MPHQLNIKINRLEKGVDAFVDRIVSNCVSNFKGLEQHPFRQLLVGTAPAKTRSKRTIVGPLGKTSLMKNSVLSFLFDLSGCAFTYAFIVV